MPEAEIVRRLTPEQAIECHARIDAEYRPATLHPAYVLADAFRQPGLEPLFLLFEMQGEMWLHGLHRMRIVGTDWWDASSPYGYGGPTATSSSPEFLRAAWAAYAQWMREQLVVVEYLRFHPMNANQRGYTGTVVPNRQVVWTGLQGHAVAADYSRRIRYSVSKAEKAALLFSEQHLGENVQKFAVFYRTAMTSMGADGFYQFDDDYFRRLAAVPGALVASCSMPGSKEWLAACIVLEGDGVSEYHLAASNAGGRALNAAAWLLDKCIAAAQQRGQRAFYFGGGTDAKPDNSLLFFKSGFSDRQLLYQTGNQIFNAPAYAELQKLFPEARSEYPGRPIFYRKV